MGPVEIVLIVLAAVVIMALGVDLMSEHPVLFRKKD